MTTPPAVAVRDYFSMRNGELRDARLVGRGEDRVLAEAWGRDEGVKRVYMPELRPCAIRTGEYDGGPAREATHFDPFGLDGAGCR